MKTLCHFIWWLSETSGVGLGRFAPWVFGKMIGSTGVEVDSLGNPLPKQ